MIATKGTLLIALLCLGMSAFAAGGDDKSGDDKQGDDKQESGGSPQKAVFEIKGSTSLTAAQLANLIVYHGGPVLLGTPKVYYIWYGNWTSSAVGNSVSILTNLAMTIGNSPWFNINQTYSSTAGPVSGAIAWGGFYNDNYSQGTSLSDTAVLNIVKNAINGGHLPKDPNGVYFVLSSPDVKETSGFCSYYCGWHSYASVSSTDIKYAFIGNPATQCLSACAAQSKSPNGNPGADAMASVIAHELSESVTDPDLNAWYDRNYNENADKCAWTFGTTKPAANASAYNVTLGGLQYLIQQNWVNSGAGYCALSH